jgi:hypothetical protein
MNPEQITTISLNILASGSVTIFLLFVIRSLKREIQNLNKTIETQNKTLDIIERRVAETEKAGNIYKSLFDDLPDAVDKYNQIIRKTKDSVIEELDRANQSKDAKLKQVAELRLKEVEVVQPIITQLTLLNDRLHQTINEAHVQLRSLESISHLTPTLVRGTWWSDQKAHEEGELASHLSFILSRRAGKGGGSDQLGPLVPESVVPVYEAEIVSLLDKKEDEKRDR